MRVCRTYCLFLSAVWLVMVMIEVGGTASAAPPEKPAKGDTKKVDLGGAVTMELV